MRKTILSLGFGLLVAGCSAAGSTTPNGADSASQAVCYKNCCQTAYCPPHQEFIVFSPPHFENLPPGELPPDEKAFNERMVRELDAERAALAATAH